MGCRRGGSPRPGLVADSVADPAAGVQASPPVASAVAAPLSFALRLEGGQAAAVLERPALWRYGLIEQLVLGWSDVRYPFDLSRGLSDLRRRRGRLRTLGVRIALERLVGLLDRRALGRFGISEPWLGGQVGQPEGDLVLRFRAQVGGRQADVTVGVTLAAGPGAAVRLRFAVPRVYGALPLPAPLLLAGWAGALGAGSGQSAAAATAGRPLPALVRCDRLSVWQLDLGGLILFDLLPARGWRLPERSRARLASVRVSADAVDPGARRAGGLGAGRAGRCLAGRWPRA